MLSNSTYLPCVTFQNRSGWLNDLLLIGIGSILIALSAPISIGLPFTPVPIALAPHLCIALGVLLGPNRGTLAVYRHHFFGHKFALFGRSGPIDRTLFISSSRGTFLATRSKDEKIPDTGTVRLARRK